jgi:O-antigen ligase
MGIILLLSYLVGMKLLPVMSWMNEFASSDNPSIFHSHITQNNMMAFAVFLALLECRDEPDLQRRTAWAVYALLGIVDVLFMVQGRTGYLITLILLGWFVWASLTRLMRSRGKVWGWRQAAMVVLAFSVLAFATYHVSSRLHERVGQVITDYQAWTPDHGQFTSTGQRLDFYSNTLQIVRQHPLFGVGTGGFPAAYLQQIQGKDITVTNNPHNEFLMLTVQTGVIGLALLLYLFYTQWRTAPKLPTPFEQDAARGLVLAYAANCSLNSALMDHADGLFFAFMTAALFAGLQRGGARA